jgi:pimeloyl-ACP methyl ester carboxylesterase
VQAARPELAGVPLAVLGESMGAAVALLVASEDTRVRAVVADSAFARLDAAVSGRLGLFGPLGAWMTPHTQRAGERLLGVRCADVAPEAAIARIAPRPVLLIHGASDTFIHPENAYRLKEAGGGNVTLWEAPGAAHCQCIAVAEEEYARRVRGFLQDALNTTPRD